jgi:hypothetical protein
MSCPFTPEAIEHRVVHLTDLERALKAAQYNVDRTADDLILRNVPDKTIQPQ